MLTKKNKLAIVIATVILVTVILADIALLYSPWQTTPPNIEMYNLIDDTADASLWTIVQEDKTFVASKLTETQPNEVLQHAIQSNKEMTSPADLYVSGNKYFLLKEEYAWLAPYKYELLTTITQDEIRYHVYKSPATTNMGVFLYDVLSYKFFDTEHNENLYEGGKLKYAILKDKHVWSNGEINSLEFASDLSVTENSLTLKFNPFTGHEIYFYLKDAPILDTTMYIKDANREYTLPLQHDGGHLRVYLGHQLEGDITISFEGTFIKPDEVQAGVQALSITEYDKFIDRENWTDVKYDIMAPNLLSSVEGKINAPADGIFQFSVPYNTRWTAFVDGNKVDIFSNVDDYILIKLSSGEHNIQFVYTAPIVYICLGLFIVAFLGFCIVLLVIFYIRYRRLHPKPVKPKKQRKLFNTKKKRKNDYNAFPPSPTKKRKKRKKRSKRHYK